MPIEAKITEHISDFLNVPLSSLGPDSTFVDLGVDDFDKVEIFMWAEFNFHFEFSDEEFESAFTIGDLVALVQRKTT